MYWRDPIDKIMFVISLCVGPCSIHRINQFLSCKYTLEFRHVYNIHAQYRASRLVNIHPSPEQFRLSEHSHKQAICNHVGKCDIIVT